MRRFIPLFVLLFWRCAKGLACSFEKATAGGDRLFKKRAKCGALHVNRGGSLPVGLCFALRQGLFSFKRTLRFLRAACEYAPPLLWQPSKVRLAGKEKAKRKDMRACAAFAPFLLAPSPFLPPTVILAPMKTPRGERSPSRVFVFSEKPPFYPFFFVVEKPFSRSLRGKCAFFADFWRNRFLFCENAPKPYMK